MTSSEATAPQMPEKAFVIATNAIIFREPNPSSATVAQLHRGESLEVLATHENFTQVRYRIEDEFPVMGWIPTATLSKPAKSVPKIFDPGQSYVPEAKGEIQTLVKEFPTDTPMNEKIIIPKTEGQRLKLEPKKAAPPLPPVFSHKKDFGFSNELSLQLGMQSWEESIKTKQASGAFYSGPFLRYELSGLSFQVGDVLDYRLQDYPLSVGLNTFYRFTFFSDSVGASNANISKSSIQAQYHEFELTPYVRWHHLVAPGWRLEPEIGPTIGFHSFVTNQLQDIPTSKSVSRSGQAVLFGVTAFYSKVNLKPTVRGPWNLRLSPELAMLLSYSFSEYPSSSDSHEVRTGEPSGADMSFSYGFEFGWNLEKFRGPNSELLFNMMIQNFARNYSGGGNRAGTQTLDASATSSTTFYSIGYRYLF